MFKPLHLIYLTMKIAVTRLEEKSKGTEALFARYGHKSVIIPTMKTAPIEDTASIDGLCTQLAHSKVDFLIFSSTMGVKYFFNRCTVPEETAIIAVGPKTADAINELQRDCETISSFSSDHFASHLAGRIQGRTVGIVRPDVPNPQLVDSLKTLGASVVEGVAYRLLPAGNDIKNILANVDAVLFTSGKSFTLANVASGDMKRLIVIAIGPKTAGVLLRAGIKPAITGNGTLEDCLEQLSIHSR